MTFISMSINGIQPIQVRDIGDVSYVWIIIFIDLVNIAV